MHTEIIHKSLEIYTIMKHDTISKD